MKHFNRETTITIIAAVAVLATMYFTPVSVLRQVVPTAAIRFRIIGPLAVLSLAGAFMLPWRMELAMVFSLIGDFMGAAGSFPGQMGAFTVAHIMLIAQFVIWIKGTKLTWRRATLSTIPLIALLLFALCYIIPHSPAGALQIGCTIYAILICAMTSLAWMLCQKMPLISSGATLFLLSDMILAWNRFVSPLDGERWLIMVPYYLGQLFLWLGVYAQTSMKWKEL